MKAVVDTALAWARAPSFTLTPRDPKNLEKVKVGELLDITYSREFAIAVRSVQPKK